MASPSTNEATAAGEPQKTQVSENSDLLDLYQRRGAKNVAVAEASTGKKKHDVDSLSDRDLERITVSLKNEEDNEDQQEKKLIREKSRNFRHYTFVKRWEPLRSSDATMDVEWFIASPEVLPEDNTAYLCDMCRHIDFNLLFSRRGLPSGPVRISINGLWRVMQEEGNSCAFCRMLRQKIVDDGLVSGMTAEDILDGGFYLNVVDEGPKRALRLEVELRERDGTPERFLVHKIEERSQQPLVGRFVRREHADMTCLRNWLDLCEEMHQVAHQEADPDLVSLRVIDTEELRVREVEMPFRYTCLSYVWGKGSQTQYTTVTKEALEAPRGLDDDSLGLPQTIKDAIKVTQEAGLRYLWIDALCILQDDPADKANVISKMGLVYGGATLTIVASTNANPQEGLPGMGTAPRLTAQTTAEVQGMTLAVMLHDARRPVPDIEDSVWSSRAWTFQERALSQRSVHFTRSQMVFKCVHAAEMFEESVPVADPTFRYSAIEDQTGSDLMFRLWSDPSLGRFANKGISMDGVEDLIMVSESLDLKNLGPGMLKKKAPVFKVTVDAARDFMSSLGETQRSTPWDLYRLAVENYTKRKLSWESDAVDAFGGVEHVIRQGTNTKFWYGLPSFAFEQSLVWNPAEVLERRSLNGESLFPSWSWAAWRGRISYRGRGWKNSIYWEPVSVVRWMVRVEPKWIIDNFKESGERTEEEVEEYSKGVAKSKLLLRELDGFALYHVDNTEDDGWTVEHDGEYNRHIYAHAAYQNARFTYPVSLPGQTVDDRPDGAGTLHFMAHAVPVVACDMKQEFFKMGVEDCHLQIGYNDEDRSSNYRPYWKRIIYHQGYRAGFLSLNAPYDPSDGSEYRLVAITRGSLPHVPPPTAGWDFYWGIQPRKLQYHHFKEEWTSGPSKTDVPNETVEPQTGSKNENGDPHWDEGRFGGVGIFDVYDVLLLRKREGISERIGGGKVSYYAFWAARPQRTVVTLA
ncbi:heterokaryon incompatibility protein-domain-containing protein [Colletotrichum cereale]|nr:heterokaryon incompatibility protein-domain-containing protein [Colletotrichum cereale]